jgi:hypothetical protein
MRRTFDGRPWLALTLGASAFAMLVPAPASAQLRGELGTDAQVACAPTMILTPPDQTLTVVGS